ncbi:MULTISPECIES: hypothetical protein [unclassified Agrococcus]|uniref:hypothetical protein n=1 Tax=unclassified Agrococcus TaxID=2615065 RepID=UPI003608A727
MRQPRRSAAHARRRRALPWVAFAAAVGIQLWGLYAPSTPDGPGIPGLDKVAHVGMFALAMATGVIAGLPPRLLAAALLVHAGISEVVQGALLPTRSGDAWDAVADAAGIALGWLVATPFAPSRARRPAAVVRRPEASAAPVPGREARPPAGGGRDAAPER